MQDRPLFGAFVPFSVPFRWKERMRSQPTGAGTDCSSGGCQLQAALDSTETPAIVALHALP